MNSDLILNTYLSKNNITVLFWEYDKGWSILKHGCKEIDEKYIQNGPDKLINIIDNSYKHGFSRFISILNSRMKGNTTKVNAVILPNIDNIFLLRFKQSSIYYKFSCYLSNEEKTNGILLRIEMLSSEESYRYRLAKNITNDKNPLSFNMEIQHLFKNNPNTEFAVIQLDIENFKLINHIYGEDIGDEIIKHIINSLKFLCDDDQLYVRLTADVFMIVTPYINKSDIIKFIKKINKELLNYNNIPYKIVYGISKIINKNEKLRVYGDRAALARKSIKNNALHFYAFYTEELDNKLLNHWIEMNMASSLAKKEFVMYLQPKYSISSNTLVGAEALVRWIHPEKGIILPTQFIPLFEQNGFIVKLDKFIWEEACKFIRNWIDNGNTPIPISVNVSRRNMIDNNYINTINKLVKKYDINKELLELEITETVDDLTVTNSIKSLKKNGYTLLMDDFGSGYSSLNMLKDTQFDVIKIDREFLTDFIESDRGKNIVNHTINMTQEIGLNVIAEGVETLDQAKFLSECGCDIVQGYYYAKPMPINEFITIYSNGEKLKNEY